MDQMIRSSKHVSVYDVVGPAQAFPIVFVHGAAWTRNMWVPQIEALSDEFRVIAVDLPGHGTLREQPFQLATACQTVIESLRQETHERALIVGLSLGGYVAMACAHAYTQDIAGLMLSGCCIDYRGIFGLLSRLDSTLVTTLFPEHRLTRMQEKALLGQFPKNIIEPQLKAGFFWKAMPQIIKQANHLCNLDQPEAFTQQVRILAQRLSAATRA
jgi:pimeloyl-ACP methyl ester carboxylesterase